MKKRNLVEREGRGRATGDMLWETEHNDGPDHSSKMCQIEKVRIVLLPFPAQLESFILIHVGSHYAAFHLLHST